MSSLLDSVRKCLHAAPVKNAGGDWEADFIFPPSFTGFDGHFPNNPVVPGVAQIMAAMLIAGTDQPLKLHSVKRCKFLGILRPGCAVHARVTIKPTDADLLSATAELTCSGVLCSQMSLLVERITA